MPNNYWTIRGERVSLSPFFVAGIVNITPDSFSDGGLYFNTDNAVNHALELWEEGARILDFGGESTRPGSEFVGENEESVRLKPVLARLISISKDLTQGIATGLPAGFSCQSAQFPYISVDTWRASTSAMVLEMGVDIINDISGAMFDPAMPEVLGQYKPGYILGHSPEPPRTMQNAPRYNDVVEELYTFFAGRVDALVRAGLPQDNIVLDPGIGFGKNLEHNLAILKNISRYHSLGCPICIGVSRKSLFGDFLALDKGTARDSATQVVTALMASCGAQIHRVHAVRGAVQALRLAKALHSGSC